MLTDWREVRDRDRRQGVSNIFDLNNWKVGVLVFGGGTWSSVPNVVSSGCLGEPRGAAETAG